MSKKFWVTIFFLFLSFKVSADTCAATYKDVPFQGVATELKGSWVICYYGTEHPHQTLFQYTIEGKFIPDTGPWFGDMPGIRVYCDDSYRTCVFKQKVGS